MASVRRPWGNAGLIAVTQFSDDDRRLAPGAVVYLKGNRAAKVLEAHRAGTAVILKLDVVRGAREANALRGTILEMEREDLPEPPDGAFYHFEIVGTRVQTTDGEDLGVLKEIITTGANDVYVVGAADESRELLIPAIEGVVLNVDIDAGLVTVDLPEGLR